MASKYICSQCERKFIDWGAEKLGFKCPDCDDSELTEISFEPAAKAKKKPTLKRAAPKKVSREDLVDDDPVDSSDSIGDDDDSSDDDGENLDGFSVTDGSDDDSD